MQSKIDEVRLDEKSQNDVYGIRKDMRAAHIRKEENCEDNCRDDEDRLLIATNAQRLVSND